MDLQSVLGYSRNSPYKNSPFLDIFTPEGLIDMSNTDMDLIGIDNLGNKKKMKKGRKKPYKFAGDVIREIPVMQVGGLAAKMRNQYLSGISPANTSRLAEQNLLNEAQQQRLIDAKLASREVLRPAKKLSPVEKKEAAERKMALNYATAMVDQSVRVDEYGDLHRNLSEYTPEGKLWKGMKNVGKGLLDATIVMDAPLLAYKLGKPLVKKAGQYLTEKTALKNTYNINPFAEKLNNPNTFKRIVNEEGYTDFVNSGVVRSRSSRPDYVKPRIRYKNQEEKWIAENLGDARETPFPAFAKGKPDKNYLPKEGNGYIYETNMPLYKKGDNNPVTDKMIRSRHWGYRPVNPETGEIMSEIPASQVKVFNAKPHWLKGYREVPNPTSTQSITRGPISWEDAVNKIDNPNFDAQTYLNHVGGQGYVPPTTDPLLMAKEKKYKKGGMNNPYMQRGGMAQLLNYLFEEDKDESTETVTAPTTEDVEEQVGPTEKRDDGYDLAMQMVMAGLNPYEEDARRSRSKRNSGAFIPTNKPTGAQAGINPAVTATEKDIFSSFPVTNLGIWGDKSHQARKSDHNTGDAQDFGIADKNVGNMLAEKLRAEAKQRNVKYIIFNRRIWNPSISNEWRPYTGDNPHSDHVHVSYNR